MLLDRPIQPDLQNPAFPSIPHPEATGKRPQHKETGLCDHLLHPLPPLKSPPGQPHLPLSIRTLPVRVARTHIRPVHVHAPAPGQAIRLSHDLPHGPAQGDLDPVRVHLPGRSPVCGPEPGEPAAEGTQALLGHILDVWRGFHADFDSEYSDYDCGCLQETVLLKKGEAEEDGGD